MSAHLGTDLPNCHVQATGPPGLPPQGRAPESSELGCSFLRHIREQHDSMTKFGTHCRYCSPLFCILIQDLLNRFWFDGDCRNNVLAQRAATKNQARQALTLRRSAPLSQVHQVHGNCLFPSTPQFASPTPHSLPRVLL